MFYRPGFIKLRQAATAVWGSITGTLSDQTDLQAALNSKVSTADLTTVPDILAFAAAHG